MNISIDINQMLYTDKLSAACYGIVFMDDLMVLLIDYDRGVSVTNDAYNVIRELNTILPDGIRGRRVYYRDTRGRYDQIFTYHGIFTGFAPCTESQQKFLKNLYGLLD